MYYCIQHSRCITVSTVICCSIAELTSKGSTSFLMKRMLFCRLHCLSHHCLDARHCLCARNRKFILSHAPTLGRTYSMFVLLIRPDVVYINTSIGNYRSTQLMEPRFNKNWNKKVFKIIVIIYLSTIMWTWNNTSAVNNVSILPYKE